jgi:hypothetical protein
MEKKHSVELPRRHSRSDPCPLFENSEFLKENEQERP